MALRQVIGCWVNERWRAECALSPTLGRVTGLSWLDIHNRNERLSRGSGLEARACLWTDSSMLTVTRVFPRVGGRLLERAAREWPFRLQSEGRDPGPNPRASVVIPVAGRDRRAQCAAVVQSFFAQSVTDLEIIVVEHSEAREYEAQCPPPIRYRHIPRKAGEAFNKSKALNTGARAATGPVLILHDGDIVVPMRYVESVLERTTRGFEGLQPMRLLFYLDQPSAEEFTAGGGRTFPRRVGAVGHNFPGGSTAVTTQAYWAIGGSDERFEERGLDDNDFLGRLKTRRFFAGGYLPAIHLWHPTDLTFQNRPEMRVFKAAQLQKSPDERIRELREHGGHPPTA
jgi:hypothetical protein